MIFDVLCPGYPLEVYGFRRAQHRAIYSLKTKGWLLWLFFYFLHVSHLDCDLNRCYAAPYLGVLTQVQETRARLQGVENVIVDRIIPFQHRILRNPFISQICDNLWMSAPSHSIPATLHDFKTPGSCDLRPWGSDIVEATCGRYGHATRGNGKVPPAGFDLWANSPNTLNIWRSIL